MADNVQSVVDHILSAIDYGRLSPEETERRIQALLDSEISRTDTPCHAEVIHACQTLLYELHTHGELPFESHLEENLSAVKARYQAGRSKWTVRLRPQRVIAVAACLLVFFGAGASLCWRYFSVESTRDEQQYVIQKRDITLDVIQNAIAEHNGIVEIETSNQNELIAFLGFDPGMPMEITTDWQRNNVYATVTSKWIDVTTQYTHIDDTDKHLTYTKLYYTSNDEVETRLEQDQTGQFIMVNDTTVYVSTNINHVLLVWRDDCTVHTLIGNTSFDEITVAAKELIGGV